MKGHRLLPWLAPALLLLAWAAPAEPLRGVPIRIPGEDGREITLYEGSHALLIGAGDYVNGWPKLPGAMDDLDSVRRVLEQRGFQVTEIRDPDHARLRDAFDRFIGAHGDVAGNRLLVYFAGHGHTLPQSFGGEMGYIVPVDAPNPTVDRKGFLAKALDMQQIEVYAKRIQSRHALFLFDSCFSGSIFALSRAVPGHISYKAARPVRQFITSGSADEAVPDESLFRAQLVAALNGEADHTGDGYVTGTELGMFLQDKVVGYSRGSQHPQYGKIRDPRLDKGDFVFALAERTTSAAPPVVREAAADPDAADAGSAAPGQAGPWYARLWGGIVGLSPVIFSGIGTAIVVSGLGLAVRRARLRKTDARPPDPPKGEGTDGSPPSESDEMPPAPPHAAEPSGRRSFHQSGDGGVIVGGDVQGDVTVTNDGGKATRR